MAETDKIEQRAIEALLQLVYAAWCLADDSEDLGDGYHKVDHDNFRALCDQLDALDELPQDRPGYIMAPAAKARWALRGLSPSLERVAVLEGHNKRLREALELVRSIIMAAAMEGFNYQYGDWADRLFASQALTGAALKAQSDG